jgi:hypothetical protein
MKLKSVGEIIVPVDKENYFLTHGSIPGMKILASDIFDTLFYELVDQVRWNVKYGARRVRIRLLMQ